MTLRDEGMLSMLRARWGTARTGPVSDRPEALTGRVWLALTPSSPSCLSPLSYIPNHANPSPVMLCIM